jgi:hypothetical protein
VEQQQTRIGQQLSRIERQLSSDNFPPGHVP